MQAQQENPLGLVWGIEAIAGLIGRTERQTQYLLAKGELPAKLVGGRWVVKRDALLGFFDRELAS